MGVSVFWAGSSAMFAGARQILCPEGRGELSFPALSRTVKGVWLANGVPFGDSVRLKTARRPG